MLILFVIDFGNPTILIRKTNYFETKQKLF